MDQSPSGHGSGVFETHKLHHHVKVTASGEEKQNKTEKEVLITSGFGLGLY